MRQHPRIPRLQPAGVCQVLVGTQEEQKKYLGNAVVTIMAKVWCEAIVPTLHKEAKTAVA